MYAVSINNVQWLLLCWDNALYRVGGHRRLQCYAAFTYGSHIVSVTVCLLSESVHVNIDDIRCHYKYTDSGLGPLYLFTERE